MLDISANNSAYEHPWHFWCTAKNLHGTASQEIILTRPTPTAQSLPPGQPVCLRWTPMEIVTEETTVSPFAKNGSYLKNFDQSLQTILLKKTPAPPTDLAVRKFVVLLFTLFVISLIFFVVLTVLVTRLTRKLDRLVSALYTCRINNRLLFDYLRTPVKWRRDFNCLIRLRTSGKWSYCSGMEMIKFP